MGQASVKIVINKRDKHIIPANTHMRKMCFKKCKTCRGEKCPNYYGYVSNKKDYYSGVLHGRKIKFSDDISQQKQPMDKSDKLLVGGIISVSILLTIFGGLLF